MDGFFKKFLYRFLYPASLIFTVISLAVLFAFCFLASDSATKTTAILFLIIAAYSAFVAFVSCIFYTKMVMTIKIPSHFLCTFIPFYIAMRKVFETTYLWFVIGFIVIYIAVATIVLIAKSKKREKEQDEQDYKKMFSK